MILESVTRLDVVGALEKEFGCASDEAATKVAAVDEHIRAAVMIESRRQGDRQILPVATSTITRTVRQRLSPLWPEFAGDDYGADLILEELGQLAKLGEFMKVDSFHWIPAPERFILVEDSTLLLVSPFPLAALPFRVRKAVQVIGRARLIDSQKAGAMDFIPLQRLVDWMGGPNESVDVWSSAFVESNVRNLAVVEGLEDVDVFSSGSWRRVAELKEHLSSPQLYRRKVSVGGHPHSEYGLCRLNFSGDGCPTVASALSISRDDARRLQGSMPSTGGQAQTVKFQRWRGNVVVLLPRPMPMPESVFLSLGWMRDRSAPGDWPRKYTFSGRLVPLLTEAFELLGYQLIEQLDGGAGNG
ncbi:MULTISPECIES: hypothetical protein [unclassified Burkholderia]|uniref:hypothetical protein n=1 Tax=unclassified Burkholderia TaxID=2613784 RepID=UPI000F5729AA|nr:MULTISPECIES: hypothetical protein [unclassified Burkholderia]